MKVFKSIAEMHAWSQETQRAAKTIGLVPTMGFLHEGHLSLIRASVKNADKTVVSIFVNPAQFGPNEDFEAYPRDFERDLSLCKAAGVDVVFAPDKATVYHPQHQTYVKNDLISQLLCGKTRPIHFRGVTTVVTKLFNIIDPDVAVFGQKDAQQSIIIKNMVRDLNFKTQIVVEPIIREKDGLAMSSRNKYLSESQRRNAVILYQSLKFAEQELLKPGAKTESIKDEIIRRINNTADCRVDYVEFVNADTLLPQIKKGDKVLLALAVFVGTTRLIDNIILNY